MVELYAMFLKLIIEILIKFSKIFLGISRR